MSFDVWSLYTLKPNQPERRFNQALSYAQVLERQIVCWQGCFSRTPQVSMRNLKEVEVYKAWEEDVPLTVGIKNAEFLGRKGIWQNFQDKEETSKANWAALLGSAQAG